MWSDVRADVRTDRQTDRRYQAHYLPALLSYAVDNLQSMQRAVSMLGTFDLFDRQGENIYAVD